VLFGLSRELKEFQEKVRQIARAEIEPHAAETDRSEQYPWHCVDVLKREGFMGMTIPVAYGGRARLLSSRRGAHRGDGEGVQYGAHLRRIEHGSAGRHREVRQRGAKRLAASLVLSGDKPAICITEPEAGSAATEMTTRADREGDHYVLNGKKHWITGGGVSRLHLIFARVFEDGAEQGIGGFIVVRDPDTSAPKGMVVGKARACDGCVACPRRRSFSTISRSHETWPSFRHRACTEVSPA
jgi:alkylation response protein AidB-like acyl-CoA dehydrogenase